MRKVIGCWGRGRGPSPFPVPGNEMLNYYGKQIKRLGIDMRLNCRATEQALKALAPYAVIVATGSQPIVPKIEGIDKANVLLVRDVLQDQPQITNKNIVVIGAGMTGVEVAELYADKGNKVTVIDMLPPINPAATPFNELITLGKAMARGITIQMERKLLEIKDGEIVVEDTANQQVLTLPADTVILSMGVKPENALYENIQGSFDRVYNIGDSEKTGTIHDAVVAGSKLGYALA